MPWPETSNPFGAVPPALMPRSQYRGPPMTTIQAHADCPQKIRPASRACGAVMRFGRFALSWLPREPDRRAANRGKVMDWFNGKTSIAGIQIPNWLIILGAAVI